MYVITTAKKKKNSRVPFFRVVPKKKMNDWIIFVRDVASTLDLIAVRMVE